MGNIPFVFKSRIKNDFTSYIGCDKYELNGNKIKFWLPLVYINKTKEWYRTHGGGGNINGQLTSKHISYVMDCKYIGVDKALGKHFTDDATNKLKCMYCDATIRGSTEREPTLRLNYQQKGQIYNDLRWFQCQSR